MARRKASGAGFAPFRQNGEGMEPRSFVKARVNVSERQVFRPVREVGMCPVIVSPKIKAFWALILFAHSLHATTVAAIWTPARVVMAVDSKMMILHRDTGAIESGHTCKVLRRGSAVYIPAGLASGYGFDIRRVIAQTDEFSSPPSVIPRLREMISRSLERILPLLKKDDPARYARFKEGLPIVLLYISWPDGPVVALHQMRFLLFTNDRVIGEDTFVATSTTDDNAPEVLYDTPRGGNYRVPDHWYLADHVDIVRDAVNANIAGDSRTNGPPVVVIEITQSGPRWSNRQAGYCKDDRTTELEFLPPEK